MKQHLNERIQWRVVKDEYSVKITLYFTMLGEEIIASRTLQNLLPHQYDDYLYSVLQEMILSAAKTVFMERPASDRLLGAKNRAILAIDQIAKENNMEAFQALLEISHNTRIAIEIATEEGLT